MFIPIIISISVINGDNPKTPVVISSVGIPLSELLAASTIQLKGTNLLIHNIHEGNIANGKNTAERTKSEKLTRLFIALAFLIFITKAAYNKPKPIDCINSKKNINIPNPKLLMGTGTNIANPRTISVFVIAKIRIFFLSNNTKYNFFFFN